MSPLLALAALAVTASPAPVHVDRAEPLEAQAKQLTAQAAAGLDGEALCDHLTRTERLAQALTARMQKAAAQSPHAGDADPSDEALQKIERDARRAQAPGLAIRAQSAEGLDVSATLDLAAYAKQAHVAPAAARFLQAFSVFAGHDRTEDVSLEFLTDSQACTTFRKVDDGLSELAKVWGPAPACLRTHVTPRLRVALGRFAEKRTCLCEDAAAARQLAAHAAAALPALQGFDGAALGKAITSAAVAPGAKYQCRPVE